MSVIRMTQMSYFFIIMAVLSGTVAVVLFFAYDIRRCWRIVSEKRFGAQVVKAPVRRQKKHTEMPVHQDRTLKLTAEETEPLETMYLVQDITIIEAR